MATRFGHVNLIADDWGSLARFYIELFDCVPVPPERDYSGPDLAAGTGVENAALKGVHLRLPGHGREGPTLEIYQYERNETGLPPAANRRGFGHIAFAVDDVATARAGVLAAADRSVVIPGHHCVARLLERTRAFASVGVQADDVVRAVAAAARVVGNRDPRHDAGVTQRWVEAGAGHG